MINFSYVEKIAFNNWKTEFCKNISFFSGGNEHKKFTIDDKTGVISIADMLDYERAKDYFLTIQAIDGGTPPLSNVATVNISVTDCNDNAPVFSQLSYSARIREDAQPGDKILQVQIEK